MVDLNGTAWLPTKASRFDPVAAGRVPLTINIHLCLTRVGTTDDLPLRAGEQRSER